MRFTPPVQVASRLPPNPEMVNNMGPESPEVPMIKAWSFSRYENFSKCAYRAKILYIDKTPEPTRPLKEGQTEQANDRGSRIHEAAELYVNGGVELLPELRHFIPEFQRLRDLYAQGLVSLEGDWAFDRDWMPCGNFSDSTWVRIKLDALVTLTPEHLVIIDYKTGRRDGNQLKHAEQTRLYALAAALRNPNAKLFTTELWYTDENDLATAEYTREQAMKFLKTWQARGTAMTSETEFKPNPNKFSCQWCRFGPKFSGPCTVGV